MVTAQPAPPSKGWKGDEDLASKVQQHRAQKKTWIGILGLAYGSLGVVYGDIGTSPLYVYESIFADNEITKSDVAGGISLVFWTLTLLALVKYTLIVPFANDDGEGGTFALYTFLCRNIGIAPHGPIYATDRRTMLHLASVRRFSDSALKQSTMPIWKRFAISGSAVRRWIRAHVSAQRVLFITTIIATAMILGDGVLTPSISVLSAISGLEVADDGITQDIVVGVSIAILVLLFGVQFLGTQKVTFAFAPIVVLWLTSNAAVGIYNMTQYDGAAAWSSLDPGKGINFLVRRGESGWRLLGAVMLCVTGSEAMFLDMGHFSHAGIALGFGCFAYPCLVLTYIGQGAWLMDKLNAKQLFYKSVPHQYFYPMLVLAALASIVASQALISGSFSIIRQACNMGAFPRLRVKNTGKDVEGQIYIAPVNWVLMLLCVAVVAGFQSTVALGNAYGVAVMAVFVITTLLTVLVMIACWELSLFLVVPFGLIYLAIECTFLSALLTKVPEGAWFTIAMAGTIAFMKIVWWMGTLKKHRGLAHEYGVSLEDMLVLKADPGAAQGTAADGPAAAQGKEKIAGIAEEIEGSTSTPPKAPKPRSRRLQLALCRPGGEPMSLARLRGIGIYYSDSPVGVPPVLVHFLRSIQALHEVSIFLTVRTLPVPYIERHDRLLVRVLPSAPHFYQVVARYGYMDEVDHSVKFMTHLVEAIADHMRSVADMQAVEAATALAADIAADSVRLGARPSSDGHRSRRLESISVHHIEYELGVRNSVEPTGGSYNVTPSFGSLARMSAVKTDVPLPAGATLTTSSRGAQYIGSLSRLASKPSQGGTAPPPPLPTTPEPEPERPIRGSNSRVPLETADGVVAISLTASSAASTQSTKDTADFLLHVMAHHGVVYYVGRTTPRAPRDGSLIAELSYGALYRTMDSLTQTDVYEAWSIPLEQLVELSLSVFV